MTSTRLLTSVAAAALLAGCATMPITPATTGPAPIRINDTYKTGDIDLGGQSAPSLEELVNAVPNEVTSLPDSDDKLRAPAMRDAALAYGAQGGLAATSVEINNELKAQANHLSQTYDFTRLMIKGPNGAMVLPPVISEARDTWEAQDDGKSLRVADKYYEIIGQSRFTPNAPLWHSYLLRKFSKPQQPPSALLPKSDDERKYWATYIRLGWEMGAKQGRDIFQSDLRRLERDFTGMVRYRQLLDEGKVSAPVIADVNLGVTGNDNAMRVNDRAVRITQDPKLNVNASKWSASPSSVTKEEAATPPGKTFIAPRPKQDAGRATAAPTTPVETKVTYQSPDPVRVKVKPATKLDTRIVGAAIAPMPAPVSEADNAAVAPERPRYF